jgi:hypothetical protein
MRIKYHILSIVLAVSCNTQNNDIYQFDPITIIDNEISLSEIADEVSYIPMENNSPIGMVYRYQKVNNTIYLSVKDTGILAMDHTGRVLLKIGSIGRGPGEYTFYVYFTVDEKTETVYVMDSGNIIKAYSKHGKYLRSFSLKEYGEIIDAIEFFNSKIFVTFFLQTENAKYSWIILDTLGNLINVRKRTIPPFSSNWLLEGGLYKFDNLLFYWNPFADTVYSINPDNTYETSFIISEGEHRFPKYKFYSFEERLKYLQLDQILETEKYLIIRYSFKESLLAIIDKKSRKSFKIYLESQNPNGIVNNLDGGVPFLPTSYYVEHGQEFLIGLIFPYEIKSFIASNNFRNSIVKFPEKKKEFEKLANSLKETDNPVLMIVRLKK